MAVPPAVLPPPARTSVLPPSASMLRVSVSASGVRKVLFSESGMERRKESERKGLLSKKGCGSVGKGGSGGWSAGRVDKFQRVFFQPRSRSGEVQRSFSQGRPRSGLPKLSFAEVVAHPMVQFDSGVECTSPGGILARQTGSKDGFPAVCFSSHDIQAGVEKFRFALIMKFHLMRPPTKELHHLISSKWGVQGRFSFSEIWDSFHVFINLESEADVQKGLRCKVRKFGSCGFKLFRWFPDYDPLMAPRSVRQWIRLPGLPLFLYDKAFAKIIVSSFAKLQSVDGDSESCRNLSHMRLCVVLKEGVIIPEKVWVHLSDNRSYWQYIEMEDLQISTSKEADRTSNCVAEGHREDGNSGSVLTPDCVEERVDNCATVDGGDNLMAGFMKGLAGDGGKDYDQGVGCSAAMRKKEKVNGASEWQTVSYAKKKRSSISKKEIVPDGTYEIDVCPAAGLNGKEFIVDGTTHVITSIAMAKDSLEKAIGSDNLIHVNTSTPIAKDSLEKAMGPTSSHAIKESDGVDMCAHVTTTLTYTSMAPTSIEKAPTMALANFEKAVGTQIDTHGHVDPLGNKKQNSVDSSPITHNLGSAHPIIHVTSSSNSTIEPLKSANAVPPRGIRNVVSSPNTQVTCSHGPIDPLNDSTAGPPCDISSGSLVSPVGQTKAVPCDSLELLRKKTGRHRLAYAREGHNDQISIATMSLPKDKIASYGNDIICYDEDFVPLDARALYLRLKAEHSDDADIFHVMDHVMDQMYKSASGAQNDSPGEDSDGFIDLSRILKHPRHKSKGSRNSGRSCPKKKGSNVVY